MVIGEKPEVPSPASASRCSQRYLPCARGRCGPLLPPLEPLWRSFPAPRWFPHPGLRRLRVGGEMAAEGPEASGSPGRAGAEGALGGGGGRRHRNPRGAGGPKGRTPSPCPPSGGSRCPPPPPIPQGCNGAVAPPEPEEPPPAAPEDPPPPRDPEPPPEEPPLTYPPEFEKLWQAARSNPHDFTAWTELLQYVEQEVIKTFF
ncbi:cuticle collagen 1-like [Heliangelus exortis]|uniref:cuticle collagen 1-like n=1 Tax=Heliangelus exortis TaxID=472823 RepID=UPI003A91C4DF